MTVTATEVKKQIEDNEYRWYVLSVVSGQESLVIENLQERVKKQALEHDIVDYMNPTVNEVYYKGDKKIFKPKKLYPGYVFIKSKMNEKIWYVIRNTPGVRLIVGAETRPIPLTQKEYDDMVKQIDERNQRAEFAVPFQEGDVVVLRDGDFNGMKGVVTEIDVMKGFLYVNVEILGRNTPVMVSFEKVERVA
jgi:transcriptional antiterminator NusG